jgi:hypothetical protein
MIASERLLQVIAMLFVYNFWTTANTPPPLHQVRSAAFRDATATWYGWVFTQAVQKGISPA